MTVVEDVTSAAHACAVPTSDEQLWEMTARFVADGLAAREQVVYFADGTAEAVLERLDADGVAYRSDLADGRFTVVPTEATRALLEGTAAELSGAVDHVIDDALRRGFPGVRLAGVSAHALGTEGGVPLMEFEAGFDGLRGARPARLLCLYDRVRFPDDAIDRLRALHDTELVAPAVYDDNLLRITTPGPAVARVAGEVDHSNRPRIKAVLEAALDTALRADDSPSEITLDLSSLRFLDVAGAVSLVHAAEEFPSTHRLCLTGVRPSVLRLLERCGSPFASQLRVALYSTNDSDGPARAS